MASDAIQLQSPKDVAAQYKQEMLEKTKAQQAAEMEANLALLADSESLEWTKLSPKAQIAYIMTKPYNIRLDDGTYTTCKLKFWDAVAFVGRALELKLSILGNDLYPLVKVVDGDPRLVNVGVSSEARAKVAAMNGCKFGPPRYEEVSRPWPAISKIAKPAWTPQDIGIKVTMNMYMEGASEPAEFTAWLSEWYAGNARGTAYWDKNPMWMLKVRAKDKCIVLASGVGQSDPQEDEPMVATPSAVTSTEFKLTSKGEK